MHSLCELNKKLISIGNILKKTVVAGLDMQNQLGDRTRDCNAHLPLVNDRKELLIVDTCAA